MLLLFPANAIFKTKKLLQFPASGRPSFCWVISSSLGLLTATAAFHSKSSCSQSTSRRKPSEVQHMKIWCLRQSIHNSACSFTNQTYNEILGVPSEASKDEMKKAFHAEHVREHQTSQTGSADRKVEETGPHYGVHGFSHEFQKIFSDIFEDDAETEAADIQVEISLSLAEVVKGCKKHLSFDAKVPCNACDGSGHSFNAKPKVCPACRGRGRVTIPPFTSTCCTCRGRRHVIKDYCMACNGSGTMVGVKEVDLTIPAGIDSGDTVRVPGAGNSGRHGAHPGDLVIKLKVVKDPVFQREGFNLYVDAQISFTQAILGGELEVPTLNGKVQVKIPKGVQPGHTLILRGKGLPTHTGLMDHGDQYVKFIIKVPKSLNRCQRSIMEEFAKEEVLQDNNDNNMKICARLLAKPYHQDNAGLISSCVLFKLMANVR